ncbi:MAG: hypothetical protein JHC33_00665 [Ignisphaera sp.]|nr:hypothetical protein [Ignisphaera sp.]
MTTYGELTQRITFEMGADRKIDTTTLKSLVYDSMREVARLCVPLKLVSQSNSETILRWIDDVNFIRKPLQPTGVAGEKIDIDDLLIDAVFYMVCKRISRDKKADYEILARQAINDYQWAIYQGENNAVPVV